MVASVVGATVAGLVSRAPEGVLTREVASIEVAPGRGTISVGAITVVSWEIGAGTVG